MSEFNITIRYGSDAVKTQWIDNPERRRQTSVLFKNMPHLSGDQNVSKRPEVRAKISQAKMGAGNAMYNVLGVDNPNWKGGKMTFRGKGWNSIRTQVLRRDKNTCQQCGSTEKLEVHHIVTWRTKKNFNKLTNLVTLCHACHVKQPIHRF
jgi:5-methylcytosine-specific restriction endonuclease McrA